MTAPRIALEFQCKLTSAELWAQLSVGQKVDMLNELCGGSHLPIDQIRRICNASGYDDPVVKEEKTTPETQPLK